MLSGNKVACPVCEAEHDSIGIRLGGSTTTLACESVTPVGAVRYFPLDGVAVIGAGLGVTIARPKALTLAEQQNALIVKQREVDKALAEKRIADHAATIEAQHAALEKGDMDEFNRLVTEAEKKSSTATLAAPSQLKALKAKIEKVGG